MREMGVFMSASLELRSGWLVSRRRHPYDLALKLAPHASRGGRITTAAAPRSSFFMMISMPGNFAEEARNRVGDIDSSQTPQQELPLQTICDIRDGAARDVSIHAPARGATSRIAPSRFDFLDAAKPQHRLHWRHGRREVDGHEFRSRACLHSPGP